MVLLFILFYQRKANNEDPSTAGPNAAFLARWTADSKLNKVYAITPTYARHVQKAELTR